MIFKCDGYLFVHEDKSQEAMDLNVKLPVSTFSNIVSRHTKNKSKHCNAITHNRTICSCNKARCKYECHLFYLAHILKLKNS